ncbi:MAG: hypothetical protein K2N22_07085 [Clostridia bacterium]|nr:hypothetical protein [Clostridia bacterium]
MKTKNRNLLTVILALLCAVAVAIGVGFLLPKQEKINANAATVSSATAVMSDITLVNGSGTTIQIWPAGDFKLWEATPSASCGSGDAHFSVSVNVPANTVYTVNYKFETVVKLDSSTSGSVNANAWLERYEDDTYATQKGGNFGSVIISGARTGGTKDTKTTWVNNLILLNSTNAPKDCKVWFNLHFAVSSKGGQVAGVSSSVAVTDWQVTATDLSAPMPAATDILTIPYDGSAHRVNFTYADAVTLSDLDGTTYQYDTGYKVVSVTPVAEDSDGNPTNTYTLYTDPNGGSGYIEATQSGKYTVKFNLNTGATAGGVQWVGGGTGEKTVILTINRIDSTVTPDVGAGPWYTNKNLYNDVTITTTAGDTPGSIVWDAGQTLTAGTNNYGWTFTPTDTRNYNTKTGSESITAENLEILRIEARFTQNTTKFYTSNSLEDLNIKLGVFKIYNDGSEVAIDPADYELDGDISTAGTANILVTYTTSTTELPAREEFTDNFDVEITEVKLKKITATFTPEGNIYLSDTLEDLKQYLTVDAKYNDGTVKNDISAYTITSPSELSLGTVTVTVAADEDNTITDTFPVNVLPDPEVIELKIPEVDDVTYSGEEFDVLDEIKKLTVQQVTQYLEVTGTVSGRDAGAYIVKFKIKDEFVGSVKWEETAPVAVRYSLSAKPVSDAHLSADKRTVTLKWQIVKAKVAAVWDSENCVWVPDVSELAETTEPDFLVQTYTNSNGKSFTNRSKLAGGRTYQVTATINSAYAKNIELDEDTQTLMNSGDETYTYTPEYVPGVWDKILAFLKANWLWFVIALAALILLIIIIVVAVKCRKSKEEREEIKARKEEEKQRKLEEKQRKEEERRLQQERLEEERRLQREKLEAEREMARAKQEAELEKIRAQAQAGMAGAGMASMAMAQQPQQQAMPVPPQPVQQVVDNTNNELLKEMRQQMAELRADNKATQAQLQAMQNNHNAQSMPTPQPMQMPMQQAMPAPMYPQYPMMPQYGGNDLAMARMEAQLNAMQAEQRARYDAEQRIELAAMRAESHVDRDSRHSVDLAAMREHINGHNYNRIPDYSQPAQPAYNQPNSMDMMGALVAATLRNMANGEIAVTQSVPELPQKTGAVAQSAKYPSDAVITTTTTVDTTKNGAIRRDENFDIDGFYDPLD